MVYYQKNGFQNFLKNVCQKHKFFSHLVRGCVSEPTVRTLGRQQGFGSTSKHIRAPQNTSEHIQAHPSTSQHIIAHHSQHIIANHSQHIRAHHSTSEHITAHQSTLGHIRAHQSTSEHIRAHQSTKVKHQFVLIFFLFKKDGSTKYEPTILCKNMGVTSKMEAAWPQ